MTDRILDVNAYTTFHMLSGAVEGPDFEEAAVAVLNVTTPRTGGEHVTLQLEFDNTDLTAVAPHADHVHLSATEARELAAELESYAEDVDGDGDE